MTAAAATEAAATAATASAATAGTTPTEPEPASSRLPVFSALLFAFFCAGPALFPAEERESAPAGFSWHLTYRQGLEAALARRRPLLVYLQPAGGKPDPLLLSSAPRVLGSPPVVEGVRVGSADVEGILKRFEVKKLPALLLLDRRENVLLRSEGELPANFLTLLKRLVQKQEVLDAASAHQAEEARRLLREGKAEPAHRKAAQLIQSQRTPPEVLELAREVERELKDEGETALLRALASEGLVADTVLGGRLQELREANPHPEVRAAIDRELARLKRSTRGGK